MEKVKQLDREIYNKIKKNWDSVAKPLDSLGVFEQTLAGIGAIQKTEHPRLDKCELVVFCADNGVVEEGVTQCGQEVTALCAASIATGKSSASVMARANRVNVTVVDIGMARKSDCQHIIDRCVKRGTNNFSTMPAMSEEDCFKAIEAGKEMMKYLKEKNIDIAMAGEMGIGNTTTSTAVICSLLGLKSQDVTGRGAGLDDKGLERKIQVIQAAIDKYELKGKDALTVLRTVGGFDIAGMAGFYMGAAIYEVPVILDGLISMVAAYVAEKLMPGTKDYLLASHMSAEPAAVRIAEALDLRPVINGNMALGEGSGAVMMVPLLRTANGVYENSASFDGIGVIQYERNEG